MVKSIHETNGGIEVHTDMCGISGRIWLDVGEALVVQEWLNTNLDTIVRRKAERTERERLEKIAGLEAQLAALKRR